MLAGHAISSRLIMTGTATTPQFLRSGLLLIRLFQEATISSVGGCGARRFREICASFSPSLLPTRPVRSTSPLAGGPKDSDAHAVHTSAPMPSGKTNAGSARRAGTKSP